MWYPRPSLAIGAGHNITGFSPSSAIQSNFPQAEQAGSGHIDSCPGFAFPVTWAGHLVTYGPGALFSETEPNVAPWLSSWCSHPEMSWSSCFVSAITLPSHLPAHSALHGSRPGPSLSYPSWVLLTHCVGCAGSLRVPAGVGHKSGPGTVSAFDGLASHRGDACVST